MQPTGLAARCSPPYTLIAFIPYPPDGLVEAHSYPPNIRYHQASTACCPGRETLLAEGVSEGAGTANHVPWRRRGRQHGRQMRRRAPRSSRSHHAPSNALLRGHREVCCLWGASPRSMGARVRRSQRPRTPTTRDPACRASSLFLIVLQLPSMRCLPGRLPLLDTKNCPNGSRSVHSGDTPYSGSQRH